MTFLQQLRLGLWYLKTRIFSVQRTLEKHEQAIAREIARLASIPTDSVKVTFVYYTNGMIYPKVELTRPRSRSQLAEVEEVMATMNPISPNTFWTSKTSN